MKDSVLNFLWQQTWQISLLFVLIGSFCLLARRWSAHWRYLLWLVVLLKCLLPPFIPVALPRTIEPLAHNLFPAAIVSPQVIPTHEVIGNPDNSTAKITSGQLIGEASNLRSKINWGFWMAAFWGMGSLGFLIVAMVKAIRIQRGLRGSRTLPNLNLECEFLELAEAIGLKRRPKLCLIRGISQPFVWGILRGAIYLPETFEQEGTSRERKLIMSHELAHVLRWDAFVNFLQIVVQAVFFFHPLVWWLNRIIRHEREKCCDEMAIASLRADSREYGSAIVDRLVNYFEPACPSSSLAISGHAKDLEDRIKSVLQPGRRFRRRPTVSAVAAVLFLSLVALPWRWVGASVTPTGSGATPAATLVNLTECLNAELQQTWLPGLRDNNLAELSPGQRVLGGVRFDIRGVAQMSGSENAPSLFPVAAKMKVAAVCQHIQLLHACAGSEQPSAEVAAVRVHYQDGGQEDLPIRYGEHFRNWQFQEFEPVSDPNSAMAWTGSNPFMRARGGAVRLYRTTLQNPRPQYAVVGIEYVSRLSKAAPFLVALTLD